MLKDGYVCQSGNVSKNPLEISRTPRLLDQVRNVIRCKHYSLRTERSYIEWIKRYIYFHKKKHLETLDESNVGDFLTHLAVDRKVAASTQNQALCALVFLYREVLQKEFGNMDNLIRAKRSIRKWRPFYHNRAEGSKAIQTILNVSENKRCAMERRLEH